MSMTEKLLEALNNFCEKEYGDRYDDSDDLRKIPIAYTTVDDEGIHGTQVYADLIGLRIEYELDGESIDADVFETAEGMLEFFECMDFDMLVAPGFRQWNEWEEES